MDKLQEFIERNMESLNDADLSYGHTDRFKDKLKARHPSKAKVNYWLIASAAAVAGLILTASFSLLLSFIGIMDSFDNDLLTASLSPELVQISESYQYQVNQKQHIISKMLAGDNSEQKADILLTIDELNSGQQSMLQELANNLKPEKAMFVISRYYQAHLSVLEGIILNLDETKLDTESF
ncbi:MAG TPA: hypothetical protein DG754_01925 [Bacteroidales bacterium]|jgi:hypothetical protein|nr:hypothetical protein [Bacteroidales bacterium]